MLDEKRLADLSAKISYAAAMGAATVTIGTVDVSSLLADRDEWKRRYQTYADAVVDDELIRLRRLEAAVNRIDYANLISKQVENQGGYNDPVFAYRAALLLAMETSNE